jgi:hypothetical protein
MRPFPLTCAVAVLVCAAALPARADERKFTYSYESKTLPEGVFEFEQWATLRTRRETGTFNLWQFREELEYGITDTLTTALYLNWEVEHVSDVTGLESETEVEFETVSSEWKYKLMDASADLVGMLLYAEVAAGPEEQELELKLILDKQLGDFRFAYNFVLEFEREEEEEPNGEEEWEKESAVLHTFGVSYQANPNFAAGAEAYFEQSFEGTFKEEETLVFYAGPNLHAASGSWWVTLTALRQFEVTSEGLDLEDHEKYQFRIIVGITF